MTRSPYITRRIENQQVTVTLHDHPGIAKLAVTAHVRTPGATTAATQTGVDLKQSDVDGLRRVLTDIASGDASDHRHLEPDHDPVDLPNVPV